MPRAGDDVGLGSGLAVGVGSGVARRDRLGGRGRDGLGGRGRVRRRVRSCGRRGARGRRRRRGRRGRGRGRGRRGRRRRRRRGRRGRRRGRRGRRRGRGRRGRRRRASAWASGSGSAWASGSGWASASASASAWASGSGSASASGRRRRGRRVRGRGRRRVRVGGHRPLDQVGQVVALGGVHPLEALPPGGRGHAADVVDAGVQRVVADAACAVRPGLAGQVRAGAPGVVGAARREVEADLDVRPRAGEDVPVVVVDRGGQGERRPDRAGCDVGLDVERMGSLGPVSPHGGREGRGRRHEHGHDQPGGGDRPIGRPSAAPTLHASRSLCATASMPTSRRVPRRPGRMNASDL